MEFKRGAQTRQNGSKSWSLTHLEPSMGTWRAARFSYLDRWSLEVRGLDVGIAIPFVNLKFGCVAAG